MSHSDGTILFLVKMKIQGHYDLLSQGSKVKPLLLITAACLCAVNYYTSRVCQQINLIYMLLKNKIMETFNVLLNKDEIYL